MNSVDNRIDQISLKIIPAVCRGQRLDRAMAQIWSEYSRGRLQQWIKQGWVMLERQVVTNVREKVYGGESIQLHLPADNAVTDSPDNWIAQAIPLTIIYEDEHLLVIDKPAGLVVHPGAGHQDQTLLNALLYYAPELANLPRAGIVHRLDKDTTGLLVVARSIIAHKHLIEQLQTRSMVRQYRALTQGVMRAGGTINEPIARHPTQRIRMAVIASGKPAVTHYRVKQRFKAYTDIDVNLETGRTHQIRVHMAYKGFPLLGDPVYGGRMRVPSGASEALLSTLQCFKRQALHAACLELQHPVEKTMLSWQSPLPEDFQALLTRLEDDLLNESGEGD